MIHTLKFNGRDNSVVLSDVGMAKALVPREIGMRVRFGINL